MHKSPKVQMLMTRKLLINFALFASLALALLVSVYSQYEQRRMGQIEGSEGTLLKPCPELKPDDYDTFLLNMTEPSNFEEMDEAFKNTLQKGGHWYPKHCKATTKVAVLIPFRDRVQHLMIFLQNIHLFLQKQNIEYQIFVIEQFRAGGFNRGKLFNIGFLESLKTSDPGPPWDCYILHDVDLLPMGPGPSYACYKEPKLLAWRQDRWKNKTPYDGYFGGATSLTRAQYIECNGYSNDYWGWGGEDDDVRYRVNALGLHNIKAPDPQGFYAALKHEEFSGTKPNPCRFELLNKWKARVEVSGLNTTKYVLFDYQEYLTFTWILADLLEEESKADVKNDDLCKAAYAR